MVENDNNADVPEPTPVVEQPIHAGVMIPEHDTDTDELLDADDTSGGDDKMGRYLLSWSRLTCS